MLGTEDLERIPDPTPLFSCPDGYDWLSDYSAELAQATGYRLEEEPVAWCRDQTPPLSWIAVIEEPDQPANHALVARGAHVLHDPAQVYDVLPLDRVYRAFSLVPVAFPKRNRWGAVVA